METTKHSSLGLQLASVNSVLYSIDNITEVHSLTDSEISRLNDFNGKESSFYFAKKHDNRAVYEYKCGDKIIIDSDYNYTTGKRYIIHADNSVTVIEKRSGKYGFTKSERSSFPYWFAHWCSYQMTALCLHCWKPKYLLHDWYKPWMKLFCSYETVQMFHNKHSNHHLLWWFLQDKQPDWESMIIDWECSRFTKKASPLTAREETFRIIDGLRNVDMNNKTVKLLYQMYLIPNTGTEMEIEYKRKIDIAELKLKEVLQKLGL